MYLEWANNYDSLATTDDGSCVHYIYGCTNEWADNYDSNSNTNNNSCFKRRLYGFEWADNYDYLATQNTLSENECYRLGCMLEWADNYDELATTER